MGSTTQMTEPISQQNAITEHADVEQDGEAQQLTRSKKRRLRQQRVVSNAVGSAMQTLAQYTAM